ncbi:hypothetical protein [Anaeromicropila herbilytica]|uniref:Uncharacterized protein n=1 Tax=Anaeromicropila herbilytica TaxID=2785025 RepID=A0A7R7IC69_9FIRM|nr:hypothetical protein [Anaeromicropila herbilytica]BCN29556.1 hypothetical protein bsdtb5_08510 [Anaeromicropila herbilytica]
MNKKYKNALGIIIIMSLIVTIIPYNIVSAEGLNYNLSSQLELNKQVTGELKSIDDINYYKFTTTSNDSFYEIELRNSEATDGVNLYLYSENDSTTQSYYLSASKSGIDSNVQKLERNHTYYIVVKSDIYCSSIGKYKIMVNEIKDDVPDTYKDSVSLPLNKKKTYTLDADGDTDIFKFETTKNDSFYNIELSNSEANDEIRVELYYSDDLTTELTRIYASKSISASKGLKLSKKHTYYLIVQKDTDTSVEGKYKLKISEIKDDAPDSFNKCVSIPLNKKKTYKLDMDGDIDFFKFKTSKKGTYTLTLANKSANDLISTQIYSEKDVTQVLGDMYVFTTSKSSKTFKLKANHTYYMSVSEFSEYDNVRGAYSITINNK